MRGVLLLSLWVSLGDVSTVLAQADSGKKSAKTPDYWVDRLASKHPKPAPGARAPYEQEVWDAVDALHELEASAFPVLIAHFNDARYSFTQDSLSGDDDQSTRRETVGFLCRQIVQRQVQKRVVWSGDPRGTPGYSECVVPDDVQDALTWWNKHRDQALWQLQIANILYVIDLNADLARSDPRQRDLCEENIRANKALIDQLTASRTPLPTKPYRPYRGK